MFGGKHVAYACEARNDSCLLLNFSGTSPDFALAAPTCIPWLTACITLLPLTRYTSPFVDTRATMLAAGLPVQEPRRAPRTRARPDVRWVNTRLQAWLFAHPGATSQEKARHQLHLFNQWADMSEGERQQAAAVAVAASPALSTSDEAVAAPRPDAYKWTYHDGPPSARSVASSAQPDSAASQTAVGKLT